MQLFLETPRRGGMVQMGWRVGVAFPPTGLLIMLGKTRTFNPQIRSLILYPIELQARWAIKQADSPAYHPDCSTVTPPPPPRRRKCRPLTPGVFLPIRLLTPAVTPPLGGGG